MEYLVRSLWFNHAEAIKPKSNSLSTKEERLAEYREICLDQKKQNLIDRTDDPLRTWEPAQWDPRFPNTDVTNWCITSYEDYFRCRHLRGNDYKPCDFFKNVYIQICPGYMTDKFDRARANNLYLTLPPSQQGENA